MDEMQVDWSLIMGGTEARLEPGPAVLLGGAAIDFRLRLG